MNSSRQEKTQFIEAFRQKLSGSTIAVLADFQGLDVENVTKLRKQLRESSGEYYVVKNRLFKLALDGMECADAIKPLLEGPTAVAFHAKDPVVPAKLLAKTAKDLETFKIKGGILNGKAISIEQVKALAALPGREVLLGRMLGSIKAPAQNLVSVLTGVQRQLVRAIAAIRDKKQS